MLSMDSGWTQDSDADVSRPENTLKIKTKTILRRLTVGTVTRFDDETEPGFWFLVVQGTGLRLTGKW